MSREVSCEQCGYSLAGLVDAGAEPVCPECGARFDPAQPWIPAPWPSFWRTAATLCAPALAVLLSFLLLSAFRATRNALVWPLWLMWIIGISLAVLLVPIAAAGSVAGSTTPRLARRAAARRLWLPAIVCNLLATAFALTGFWAVLEQRRG